MKWFKSLSRREKIMLLLIIMLLIGIALRWGYISRRASDAIQERIEYFHPDSDSLPKEHNPK